MQAIMFIIACGVYVWLFSDPLLDLPCDEVQDNGDLNLFI